MKKRIDFVQVGFKGEIIILLFKFYKGFPINSEVIKNKIFLIKIWPVYFRSFKVLFSFKVYTSLIHLSDERFANAFGVIRNWRR